MFFFSFLSNLKTATCAAIHWLDLAVICLLFIIRMTHCSVCSTMICIQFWHLHQLVFNFFFYILKIFEVFRVANHEVANIFCSFSSNLKTATCGAMTVVFFRTTISTKLWPWIQNSFRFFYKFLRTQICWVANHKVDNIFFTFSSILITVTCSAIYWQSLTVILPFYHSYDMLYCISYND